MKKFAIVGAIFALGVGVAFADAIEDREALMKANGKAIGTLAAMAKGEKPFDAAVAKDALATLEADTQKFDIAALFPEGSATGKSEASPKIWENMADFTAKADAWKKAVADAVAANPQDVAALGAQVGAIGKTCGACHEVYRIKKD
ncbi:c-type cytochrome [Arvimicrobium flavum]|uniref:c-type cytochrome n=1 Tax=Arvimicrobium flavum TaxID=3393320 RepID=UPI00237A512C|nr:cytochrome c [Mesorhizobium shangrilense]